MYRLHGLQFRGKDNPGAGKHTWKWLGPQVLISATHASAGGGRGPETRREYTVIYGKATATQAGRDCRALIRSAYRDSGKHNSW